MPFRRLRASRVTAGSSRLPQAREPSQRAGSPPPAGSIPTCFVGAMRRPHRFAPCGDGLGKQIEPVDQRGRYSNLPMSRFRLLRVLSDLRLGQTIRSLHELVTRRHEGR